MRSPARSPVQPSRRRPFDRHSSTGLRGLPKKKGAGAKTVWGSAMDQDGVAYLDKKDPNYNSDEEPALVMPPQLDLAPPSDSHNAPVSSSPTDGSEASSPLPEARD